MFARTLRKAKDGVSDFDMTITIRSNANMMVKERLFIVIRVVDDGELPAPIVKE